MHGDFRDGCFGEGEEQLGAVLDEAAVFLRRARQEARHVDEGHQRDVEAVAEADEAGGLAAGVAVKNAGEDHRLVRDEADACVPSIRPKPVMMFLAKFSWISKKSPSSATFRISSFMS